MKSNFFERKLFLERVLHDEDIEKKLILLFFEKTPMLLKKMEIFLINNELLKIGETAHTLRGSLGNLSVMELSQLAEKLERATKEKRENESQQLAKTLIEKTNFLLKEMKEIYNFL